VLFTLFWTWILNRLCFAGYTKVSWWRQSWTTRYMVQNATFLHWFGTFYTIFIPNNRHCLLANQSNFSFSTRSYELIINYQSNTR
jgi:hypothetical protein